MLLEPDQAGVIWIGASEVEFLSPQLFALLDRFPHQQWHPAQIMEPGIRTAVLVDKRVFVKQRNDAGNGLTVFGHQVNAQLVGETLHQISKPHYGLRRKLMPTPGKQQELIEFR